MKLVIIIMWGLIAVARNIKFLSPLVLVFILSFNVFSKEQKTIGDLLNKIESDSDLDVRKKRSLLPKFQKQKKIRKVNLKKVAPPVRSVLFYSENKDKAKLERVTDNLIKDAYGLTQKLKKNRGRGEIWLRLAELYLEKSRLVEDRIQAKYDKQVEEYNSGVRKKLPKINLKPANVYNKKAVQLYQWFLRDYPKDKKIPQALFLLGYNYFELGQPRKGKPYYLRLTRKYPNSRFVEESNFSLGEFYFENQKWSKAIGFYQKLLKNKRSNFYSLSLYKLAWCQYKMGSLKSALKSMERVIYIGRLAKREEKRGVRVSGIRLALEAMKDIVVFYADTGEYKNAESYFEKVAGKKAAFNLIKRLAYYYADSGSLKGANFLFKSLISKAPLSPNAYEYQYQIVKSYSSVGKDKGFRDEFFKWIRLYNENSSWFSKNSSNKELVDKSSRLIESSLRNYILQVHQEAQKSRAAYSQKNALLAYDIYFDSFKKSEYIEEMHFFCAELLYDMKKFSDAEKHYSWVVENGGREKKGKHYSASILNSVLSLEKTLPTNKEIKKNVGDRTTPVPFSDKIKKFEAVALRYFKAKASISKAEYLMAIQYRLGSLYYSYNQLDLALHHLNEVVKKYPKTKYAKYASNFILDIYNIRNDYEGLSDAANSLLSIGEIRGSKLGKKISSIKERSAFKQAQEKEKSKKYKEAAEAYDVFAQSHPRSKLSIGARFNAAVNFERAGFLDKSIAMHELVLRMSGGREKDLKNKSRKSLSSIYEQLGQYEKASRVYEEYALKNPKDKLAQDFLYNAAVIYDGLNMYDSALTNYQKYYDRSRDSNRAEVFFLMGKVWKRRGNLQKTIGLYQKYIRDKNSNHQLDLESAYRIAKNNEELKRKSEALKWYKKVLDLYQGSSGSKKEGTSFAAEAKFKLSYEIYLKLLSIKILSGKNQQSSVNNKLNTINKLKEELANVIKYDDGGQIVAALTVQGQALQHMADSILGAPIPEELKGDDIKIYKDKVQEIVQPFREQAISFYQSAVERSFSFQAYNSWLKKAMVALGETDPSRRVIDDYMVHLTKMVDRLE